MKIFHRSPRKEHRNLTCQGFMNLGAVALALINRFMAVWYLARTRDYSDKTFPFPEEVIRCTLFISIITLLRSRNMAVAHPSRFSLAQASCSSRSRCPPKRFGAVPKRWRRGEVSNKLRSRGADVCQNGRPHSCISFLPQGFWIRETAVSGLLAPRGWMEELLPTRAVLPLNCFHFRHGFSWNTSLFHGRVAVFLIRRSWHEEFDETIFLCPSELINSQCKHLNHIL